MSNQLEEAVQFFKSEKAYHKLFLLFRDKYESLGRIGGTVKISTFSFEELMEIGPFFGLPGEQLVAKGSISFVDFEKQLAKTKFSSVSLKSLLDAYFGEVMTSKKEQEEIGAAQLRDFLREQQEQFPELKFWLSFLLDYKKEGRWIIQLAEQDRARFKDLIAKLHSAWITLPEEAERLPIFSQRITGDPHAFDLQQDLGKMFIHLLSAWQAKRTEQETFEIAASTEDINRLLQNHQIYRDDLLNFVTCANLIAETTSGVHPVWKAAAQEQTVQIVPLRELVSFTDVYPVKGKTVWMVENSGVCATLLDYEPSAPMICTNGQFTLATLTLLDLLAKNGCTLYYASDFDPEGLGMAQRLLDRYPEAVSLWHMDQSGYKKSRPTKILSAERLEKLNSLTDEGLVSVAKEMKSSGKAGYQEALIEEMCSDISRYIQKD